MNSSLDLLVNLLLAAYKIVFEQTPPFGFKKSSINVLLGVDITSHSRFPSVLLITHELQSSLSVVKVHRKLPAISDIY